MTQLTKEQALQEFRELWHQHCEMYLFAEEVASEKQLAFQRYVTLQLTLGSITQEVADQLAGETV